MDGTAPRPPLRRRLIGIVAGGVLLGLAGVLAGRMLEPSSPALLDGLPREWDARNRALERRVAAQFAPGSSEATLMTELQRQGFTVDSAGNAKWAHTQFPCREFVEVDWLARAGKIVSTNASTFAACT